MLFMSMHLSMLSIPVWFLDGRFYSIRNIPVAVVVLSKPRFLSIIFTYRYYFFHRTFWRIIVNQRSICYHYQYQLYYFPGKLNDVIIYIEAATRIKSFEP